jgi:aryl-alcohol dehydrogenase-like predicted oxidoreductase
MRPEVPRANGVGVMGIRALQAGALTSAIDRPLPGDHPEMEDFARAAGFRRRAQELEVSPAVLAHRYGPSLDIDTLVLGMTNRRELAECVEAAEAGPLPAELVARIDRSVDRPRRDRDLFQIR